MTTSLWLLNAAPEAWLMTLCRPIQYRLPWRTPPPSPSQSPAPEFVIEDPRFVNQTLGRPVRLPGKAKEGLLKLVSEAVALGGRVDRSHRKLAHRGSYLGRVFVSPSTLRRVAEKHQVRLPEPARRSPPVSAPWPEWVRWEPNCICLWDATHFSRARRVVFAIVDVVSRYWVRSHVSAEESSTQVQLLFADALEAITDPAVLEAEVAAPGQPSRRSLA